MDKTIDDKEIVKEDARDIFQNDVSIGACVMYPGFIPQPHRPLIVGIVSKLYHARLGSLYKIGVTFLEENPVQGTSIHYLDYPEDDFFVLAPSVIGMLASDQAIHTRLFTSRMWKLREEIINGKS